MKRGAGFFASGFIVCVFMWITFLPVATLQYFRFMMHPVKMNSIIGLIVMLSLLAIAPQPTFAACKNPGGSSGSNKVGSQVNGSSVTICASAEIISPARSVTVKSVVTATKPIAKPAPKQAAKVIPKLIPAFHKPASAAKPPKPKVIVSKKTKVVSKPSSKNATAAAADFTPADVSANVYPSNQLSVGQPASFESTAVQHYRTGTLLNLPTEVRFTPISVIWNFGSGHYLTGAFVGHAFNSAGTHAVEVRVVYAVSYRIRGSSSWISEPDTITLSEALKVEVSASAMTKNQPIEKPSVGSKVLLVGQDCLENPGTFGCN